MNLEVSCAISVSGTPTACALNPIPYTGDGGFGGCCPTLAGGVEADQAECDLEYNLGPEIKKGVAADEGTVCGNNVPIACGKKRTCRHQYPTPESNANHCHDQGETDGPQVHKFVACP